MFHIPVCMVWRSVKGNFCLKRMFSGVSIKAVYRHIGLIKLYEINKKNGLKSRRLLNQQLTHCFSFFFLFLVIPMIRWLYGRFFFCIFCCCHFCAFCCRLKGWCKFKVTAFFTSNLDTMMAVCLPCYFKPNATFTPPPLSPRI